jgi:P27 family predicted phage terminase small subunit
MKSTQKKVQDLYDRLSRELVALDFYENIDKEVLMNYCRNTILAEEIYESILANGLTVMTKDGVKRNDLLISYNNCIKAQITYAERLGISSLSRTRQKQNLLCNEKELSNVDFLKSLGVDND